MATSGNQRPRRIRPADINGLKRRVWHAILTAETLLDHHDSEIKIRAVNAIGQVGNVYRAILETSDHEERLQQLEASVKGKNP